MVETVLIGDLELDGVTDIRVRQRRKLAAQPIPGWDGDLVQDFGEAAAAIELRGIAGGAGAAERLEALRAFFRAGAPADFTASAAVAADIEQALPETLDVTQTGRAPGVYFYGLTLRRHVAPPPAAPGGFDPGFLDDLAAMDAAGAAAAAGALADAMGTAQGALDAVNKAAALLEDAMALVQGLEPLKEVLNSAGKVAAAAR
ncbi:hypothetical protein [Rhodobaculum claviforme]|uniref:Uncharacterized protein n=1 Tax=Rhodobaculum claviforme TaxID=1549854 RepID=A0A934TI94_9RHOB|nr:hypothetical protein [Rhodobaculum claviforme]MBK5926168.1 hypothetical protein [Rhodobaculum claviforme]